MFIQLFFSKVHPACHDIANGIKPGSNSKRLISMLRCMLGRKVIYVRCINCSYKTVAKSICLLDNKTFLFIQENFYASKSFFKEIPLLRWFKTISEDE